MELDTKQTIQEEEYEFPCHYLTQYADGIFSEHRVLWWGYEYESYLQFVLKRLAKHEFHTLIDIGCGEGRFVQDALQAFPDKTIVGSDYSERAIAMARSFNPGTEFIVDDLMKATPRAERTYEAATLPVHDESVGQAF